MSLLLPYPEPRPPVPVPMHRLSCFLWALLEIVYVYICIELFFVQMITHYRHCCSAFFPLSIFWRLFLNRSYIELSLFVTGALSHCPLVSYINPLLLDIKVVSNLRLYKQFFNLNLPAYKLHFPI